jgi:adenylosuccinate lyase
MMGQWVAVIGRSHNLHAQSFRVGKKIVIAVAGGVQQQQDALHGSAIVR